MYIIEYNESNNKIISAIEAPAISDIDNTRIQVEISQDLYNEICNKLMSFESDLYWDVNNNTYIENKFKYLKITTNESDSTRNGIPDISRKILFPTPQTFSFNFTVTKYNGDDTVDIQATDKIFIETERGILSTTVLNLVNGQASFQLESIEETVKTKVTVKSEIVDVISDSIEVEFI